MKDDAERMRDVEERTMICVNDIHALATQLATGSIMAAMFRRKTFARLLAFAQQPEGWREKVRPYLQHRLPCRMNFRMGARECTCGLSAMLDAAPIPGEE